MEDPKVIFLEPFGHEGEHVDGRQWCEDDDPAGDGETWVPYVLKADYDTLARAGLAVCKDSGAGALWDAIEDLKAVINT